MEHIYKYSAGMLSCSGSKINIMLPEGAELLDCQLQYHSPVMWYRVDTAKPEKLHTYVWLYTGDTLPSDGYAYRHLKTIIDSSGLVWHLFQRV